MEREVEGGQAEAYPEYPRQLRRRRAAVTPRCHRLLRRLYHPETPPKADLIPSAVIESMDDIPK